MKFVKRLVPYRIKARLIAYLRRQVLGYEEALPSFAHCGEDRILDYLFKFRGRGFYVDIGAYHPVVSSNTLTFYLRGWRGINIDAFPGSMAAFRAQRSRDINVEAGVADAEGELTYYRIGADHHQMNSFSLEFQANLWTAFGIRPQDVEQRAVKVRPLRLILDEHLPTGQHIDFMSIDVEGLEMRVLSSNNWDRYRPDAVMVEHHQELTPALFEADVVRYMATRGYRLICKTPNEIIFLARERRLNKSGNIEYT